MDLCQHHSEHRQSTSVRRPVLTRPTVPLSSQRSGGNTLNSVTRSVCHSHRMSRTGSVKDRQQSANAREDDLLLESKRYFAMRRKISSTRRASCMPGRDVVWRCDRPSHTSGCLVVIDRGLESVMTLALPLSRTIAPPLRRFPIPSRSGLTLQRTMAEFKQVRTQKE